LANATAAVPDARQAAIDQPTTTNTAAISHLTFRARVKAFFSRMIRPP
jgi:hypothetical protein